MHEYLEQGIVKKAPKQPTGPSVFYMPHKPVVREEATTAKVRMVFEAEDSLFMLGETLQHHFNKQSLALL